MMPLSIKPGAAGAPALIPVGGTAGPSLLPPPRISATPSRSSDAASSYRSAPAPAAVTVQPAVKTQKTAAVQNLRTTTTAPGSAKPAGAKSARHSPDAVRVPTPPPPVQETPRQRVKPEVPVPTAAQPPLSRVSEHHPAPTLTPADTPARRSTGSHFTADAPNRTVPNSFQNTPARQPRGGGGSNPGKATDATTTTPQNPAWPATSDSFSSPTFRHR